MQDVPRLNSKDSLQRVAVHSLSKTSQRMHTHTKTSQDELVSNKRAAKNNQVLAVTEEAKRQGRTAGYSVFRNSLHVLRTLFVS